jgi:transcriptional regulator with XRE-family HTH domain
MTKKELGKMLKQQREALGLTYYRVALGTGLKNTQIQSCEAGDTNYCIDTLMILAGYYECDLFLVSHKEVMLEFKNNKVKTTLDWRKKPPENFNPEKKQPAKESDFLKKRRATKSAK